jgi:hypothetical protein
VEDLIQSVARALGVGASIDDIRQSILQRGWSEEDAFLAIKAGEILYQDLLNFEEEKIKRKPPFGRKP